MSTQQQALIMDTIVSIRKTLKRKAYESDSDSEIEQITNRGNKLKKRARFVKQGRLAPPMGPAAYKEVAEHAGYQRTIINENPPLVDEEGYDIDSDDNDERVQEAMAAAMEDNPYSSIRLEQLLAPLTSVTDLPNHPTMSRAYTSKALTELVNQGAHLMRKENVALWKVKPLLTRLVGDNTWAPCGMFIEPNDHELFTDTARFFRRPVAAPSLPSADVVSSPAVNGTAQNDDTIVETPSPKPAVLPESRTEDQGDGQAETHQTSEADRTNTEQAEKDKERSETTGDEDKAEKDTEMQDSIETDDKVESKQEPGTEQEVNGDAPSLGDRKEKEAEDTAKQEGEGTNGDANADDPEVGRKDVEMAEAPPGTQDKLPDGPPKPDEPNSVNGGVINRGVSATAPNPSLSSPLPPQPGLPPQVDGGDHQTDNLHLQYHPHLPPGGVQDHDNTMLDPFGRPLGNLNRLVDEPFIHPLFLAPARAHPDRDVGLPEQEAEEVRRLVQLYVQKQEEVCRGTRRLYEGLRKADRLRKTVWSWSRAEAHCGANRDMSDGEDWYDKEEWGLTEDLKKGEDEVEEDAAAHQTTKKTRNRRT